MPGAVQDSPELARIARLPRRVWTDAKAQAAVKALTEGLRTASGTMTLKPIQAITLMEIGHYRGVLAPIRVGGGKTLITLLGPQMVPCRAPLLLLPASLIPKTEAEAHELRRHWKLPNAIRMESYQSLGRTGKAGFFSTYRPDLIIADEGHYLKNQSAAVTKRLARYLREARRAGEQVTLVILSGTIMSRSIRDFHHLGHWTLGDLSPAPHDFMVTDEWSRALDAKIAEHRVLEPGALRVFMAPGESVRRGYRRRLVETPGVVATQEAPLDIPLTIRSEPTPDCPEMEDAFRVLRSEGTTPDGWPCIEAVEVWRHARELASGYYYRWNPRPPKEWMDARSAWSSACRDRVAHNNRNLDSEKAVILAIREGHYPELKKLLDSWHAIKPSFKPRTEAVWVSDKPLEQILTWAAEAPGIIWISSQGLAERLVKEGLRYYGPGAVDGQGNPILASNPKNGTIVASIDACSYGQNLQAWSRNLIVDVPPNGKKWEQLLGRTHRDFQTQPVDVTVLFGCREDVKGFWQAVEDASVTEEMWGQAYKLPHADLEDVELVQDAFQRAGARWAVNGKVKGREYEQDE